MERGKLTIRVVGDDGAISLAAFLKVAESVSALVRGVDEAIAGEEDRKIEWQIESVSMHSPLALTIGSREGSLDRAEAVIHGVLQDIQTLDENALAPRYLNETLMERVKAMVSVLEGSLTRVELETDGFMTVPTQRAAAHVEEITRPYEAEATLEGTLEMVNLHGTNVFRIYDVLTGNGIKCVFSDELWAEIQPAIDKRVSVYGTMRYHRDGRPIEMKAAGVRQLAASLPQFFEVPALNITDGVDPADFIEALRADD